MYLHSYRLKNYRRLRDVHVELGSDISIFVGANNSGKTSAAQAIQMFLSGSKERFSLFDFSSYIWKALNALSEADAANDADVTIPSISLDLWFEVSESDLYLVIPICLARIGQVRRLEYGSSSLRQTPKACFSDFERSTKKLSIEWQCFLVALATTRHGRRI